MANTDRDYEYDRRVAQLTGGIAGPNPTALRKACAHAIAAATIDLDYIRTAQQQAIQRHGLPSLDGNGGPRPVHALQEGVPEMKVDRVLLTRLSRMDRYIQRATARLNRAVRLFDELLASKRL